MNQMRGRKRERIKIKIKTGLDLPNQTRLIADEWKHETACTVSQTVK